MNRKVYNEAYNEAYEALQRIASSTPFGSAVNPPSPSPSTIQQPIYTVSKQGSALRDMLNGTSKVDKKRREMLLSKLLVQIDGNGTGILAVIEDSLHLSELCILSGVTEHGKFEGFDYSDILFEEKTLRRKDLLLTEYRCEIL